MMHYHRPVAMSLWRRFSASTSTTTTPRSLLLLQATTTSNRSKKFQPIVCCYSSNNLKKNWRGTVVVASSSSLFRRTNTVPFLIQQQQQQKRCWLSSTSSSSATTTTATRPRPTPRFKQQQQQQQNQPNKYVWLRAGVPFVLFSILASWVVSQAVSGKLKEMETSKGMQSKSLRQAALEKEHDDMMEIITKTVSDSNNSFDNTKRIKRPDEILEERKQERARRNAWHRRLYRWIMRRKEEDKK